MEIKIPGFKQLRLSYLVLDYNGTLACDGRPLEGIETRLAVLARQVQIHLLTADTFGTVRERAAAWPATISILPQERQAEAKASFVRQLGEGQTAAIGNGRNDRLMLKEAALGIAVVQQEGAALEALLAADVVTGDILAALDLLLNPARLTATLRS